jgi:hypothetical protein
MVMTRFGWQWLAVVGSGWQWLAVVGSGRQWSAVVCNARDRLSLFIRYLSDFMIP